MATIADAKTVLEAQLGAAMHEALLDAQQNWVAHVKSRMAKAAREAIREAWAQEMGAMAAAIVREHIRVTDLHEVLYQRMSEIITVQLVSKTLLEVLNLSYDSNERWWFQREITQAVHQHVHAMARKEMAMEEIKIPERAL
ncbi:MAG TPA: hypothetical protein VKD28_12845 [Gemmatimonadales bacterium]|nr:hypothetical protein [Gemmatimonadales bacterium]